MTMIQLNKVDDLLNNEINSIKATLKFFFFIEYHDNTGNST